MLRCMRQATASTCADGLSHLACEGNRNDLRSAGSFEGIGAGIEGAARGEHIVQQQDAFALNHFRLNHFEHALHILPAFRPGKPDLGASIEPPSHHARHQRHADLLAHDAGYLFGLIKAALRSTERVDGHRHQPICLAQGGIFGARHHLYHQRCQRLHRAQPSTELQMDNRTAQGPLIQSHANRSVEAISVAAAEGAVRQLPDGRAATQAGRRKDSRQHRLAPRA
jgi:hypothetical protein